MKNIKKKHNLLLLSRSIYSIIIYTKKTSRYSLNFDVVQEKMKSRKVFRALIPRLSLHVDGRTEVEQVTEKKKMVLLLLLSLLLGVTEPFSFCPQEPMSCRRDVSLAGRWDPPSEPGGGGESSKKAFEDLAKASKAVSGNQLLTESFLVELPVGATGIDWGTDLSFVGVYVRGVESGSAAELAGVRENDQLVAVNGEEAFQSLDFDGVMSLLGGASSLKLEFFRGSRLELFEAFGIRPENDQDVTVTIIDEDQRVVDTIRAEKGANLRELLVGAGLDVYKGSTRYLNCRGKQLCGTCIVDVKKGAAMTNKKSNDEFGTLNLQNTEESCRLSCVTFVYGDLTVSLQPQRSGFVGAATGGSAW